MSQERERLLERMVERMGEAAKAHQEETQGEWRLEGPPPLRLLADAALKAIEEPNRAAPGRVLPCTCGHSGYGKHKPGCALAD